jgi:N-acetylglucosamine kinase-like BadF-type ATPase
MILVADSGSTKADWALIRPDGSVTHAHTMGLNPYFHCPDKVESVLSAREFVEVIPVQEIQVLYFYGAGCPDEHFCSIMRAGLTRVFTRARIEVEHDLLGAARATCGRKPGISGILGTGSNSCRYDGNRVVDNIPALGHVLGDDGGGVHLGRLALRAWYYRELPADLEQDFNTLWPEGKDAVLHRIYGEAGQNVHIAKFAQFLIKHREHPFARKLIDSALREFAVRQLKKYDRWQETEVNLVGSIADLLSHEVREVFASEGLRTGRIIRKPIDSLVEFHREAPNGDTRA